MKIKIQKLENEIKITSANKILEIREDSTTWNSESINKFLIAIATKDSENKIEIDFDENENDAQYKWIVELFKEFKKTYEEQ